MAQIEEFRCIFGEVLTGERDDVFIDVSKCSFILDVTRENELTARVSTVDILCSSRARNNPVIICVQCIHWVQGADTLSNTKLPTSLFLKFLPNITFSGMFQRQVNRGDGWWMISVFCFRKFYLNIRRVNTIMTWLPAEWFSTFIPLFHPPPPTCHVQIDIGQTAGVIWSFGQSSYLDSKDIVWSWLIKLCIPQYTVSKIPRIYTRAHIIVCHYCV